jgi:hypothetical protein
MEIEVNCVGLLIAFGCMYYVYLIGKYFGAYGLTITFLILKLLHAKS